MWVLATVVLALFVSGAVWRAFNPTASEGPSEDVRLISRQDGYYLCLHRQPLTAAQMYRLVKRRLPHGHSDSRCKCFRCVVVRTSTRRFAARGMDGRRRCSCSPRRF